MIIASGSVLHLVPATKAETVLSAVIIISIRIYRYILYYYIIILLYIIKTWKQNESQKRIVGQNRNKDESHSSEECQSCGNIVQKSQRKFCH